MVSWWIIAFMRCESHQQTAVWLRGLERQSMHAYTGLPLKTDAPIVDTLVEV